MAEKIVGIYDIKVDRALKQLDRLEKKVEDIGDESSKSAKKTESSYGKMANSLTADFKKLGAAIGLAFGVDQLVRFGAEAVKVAAKAEGIQTAFNRLNNPNLLNDLRRATRGTVDDLTLMQQAVRAQNFKVPLDQLAGFFQFATQRAIQTGESVDYLVNSIIDGIGRKSTLVLDNLGISATELQEEIKKTGDFGEAAGNIIARELEKAGDVADTTATKLARINTSLQNIKVSAGEALIDLADFGLALNDVASITNRSNESLENYVSRSKNAAVAITELSLARNEEIGVVERYRILLFGLNEEQREEIKLSKESKELSEDEYVTLEKLNQLYGKLDKKEKEQIKNLFYYNNLIKELKDEQDDANTTRERVRDIENEINEAIRQRLILLGKLRETGGETFEPIEPIENIELLQAQQLTDDLIDEQNRRDAEIANIKEQYRQSDLESEKAHQDELLYLFNLGVDTILDITNSISQIQQNAFIAEQQELERQLEQGLITREQYEEKLNNIKRKQAQSNKDAAIFQATISTAQAVVNALGSAPFTPLNIATAAAIGAAGAAQIAAIASQPLPQFAEGGFINEHGQIKGRTHGQGGVTIEAEGNEFITAAKYAQPNREILKAINSGNWEKYKVENIIAPAIEQVLGSKGFEGLSASYNLQTNWTDRNLLKAHDRGRYAMKDGFVYLGKKIETLNKRSSRWN